MVSSSGSNELEEKLLHNLTQMCRRLMDLFVIDLHCMIFMIFFVPAFDLILLQVISQENNRGRDYVGCKCILYWRTLGRVSRTVCNITCLFIYIISSC